MNERIGAIYVVIHDNEVVCFETNLKLFVERFLKIEPTARNYDWFYRTFRSKDKFPQVISSKEYFFQKLV